MLLSLHQLAHDFILSHACGGLLDYSMKVLFARLPHYKVTLFSFVINNYFVGEGVL